MFYHPFKKHNRFDVSLNSKLLEKLLNDLNSEEVKWLLN